METASKRISKDNCGFWLADRSNSPTTPSAKSLVRVPPPNMHCARQVPAEWRCKRLKTNGLTVHQKRTLMPFFRSLSSFYLVFRNGEKEVRRRDS
jgi:hypothetical protein